MSRIDHDQTQHIDPPGDAQRDATARFESISDADDSAAHIAELVRRTTERQAAPGPSPVAPSSVAPSSVAPSSVAPSSAPPDVTRVQQPYEPGPAPTQPARPDERLDAAPHEKPSRPTLRHPSGRTLVAAGAAAVLLVGGGVALSQTLGSDTGSPPTSTAKPIAPAGYAVKVTDVITDCADHSHGRTKDSFESQNCVKATRLLATGQVGGRKVLFVVSRIEMASAEAAAEVKQVLDGNGTGNLDDLIRDGKTFTGAPDKMPSSGYASVQTGKVVTVSEAGFIDGGRSANTDPSLRSAASAVAGFVSTQS